MKSKPEINKKFLLKNGENLFIRPAQESDAEVMIEYLNKVGGESDYLTFGENEFRFTVEEEKAVIKRVYESDAGLMLLGFVGDELASIGNLSPHNKQRLNHNSALGISVLKRFWRLGIARKMMEAMIGFAEACQQTEIIQIEVMEENYKAIALYKDLGFLQVGRREKNLKIGNQYLDAVLMDKHL